MSLKLKNVVTLLKITILVFFCFHANWPFWPCSRLNILLNFTFESYAIRLNLHGHKSILKWWNGGHFGIRCMLEIRLESMQQTELQLKYLINHWHIKSVADCLAYCKKTAQIMSSNTWNKPPQAWT